MFKPILVSLALFLAFPALAKVKILQPTARQEMAAPAAGKAQVVFLRASKYFPTMLTYLYEKQPERDAFISAIGGMNKVVVDVEPGERMFVSSNGIGTHFLKANVEAGKRYYVLVRPIHGYGFQLRPMRRDGSTDYNTRVPEFAEWLAKTVQVETTADQAAVLRQQVRRTLDPTYDKGWAEWTAKTPEQIAELTLNAADGGE
jgi:hypothetical protein